MKLQEVGSLLHGQGHSTPSACKFNNLQAAEGERRTMN